jgi:hypothetical protein
MGNYRLFAQGILTVSLTQGNPAEYSSHEIILIAFTGDTYRIFGPEDYKTVWQREYL